MDWDQIDKISELLAKLDDELLKDNITSGINVFFNQCLEELNALVLEEDEIC